MDTDGWLKLAPIATGIAGYLGGILSEPIKSWIKEHRELKSIRKSLYVEVFRNMDVLEHIHDKHTADSDYFPSVGSYKEFLTFDAYEYVKKNSPLAVTKLAEAGTLTALYTVFHSFTEGNRSPEHLLTYNDAALESIVKLIASASLDPFLLHAIDPKRRIPLPLNRRITLQLRVMRRNFRSQDQPISLGILFPPERPPSAREKLAAIEKKLGQQLIDVSTELKK